MINEGNYGPRFAIYTALHGRQVYKSEPYDLRPGKFLSRKLLYFLPYFYLAKRL